MLQIFICSWLILLCLVCPHAVVTPNNTTSNSSQRKKYVIEVQDHQQAMRSANPIVDLENSVLRGISDPFASPNFMMNRIAGDDLATSRELLAFQGRGGGGMQQPPPSVLGMPGAMFQPAASEESNPVKEEVVARHPLSPVVPVVQQPLRMNMVLQQRRLNAMQQRLNFMRNAASSGGTSQISQLQQAPILNAAELSRQYVMPNRAMGRGLSYGLPGGVASFVDRFGDRNAGLDSRGLNIGQVPVARHSTGMLHTPAAHQTLEELMGIDVDDKLRQEMPGQGRRRLPGVLSAEGDVLAQRRHHQQLLALARNRMRDQQSQGVSRHILKHFPPSRLVPSKSNVRMHNLKFTHQSEARKMNAYAAPPSEKINPLTGLPEDLEERSYGSISSISSLSDQTPAPQQPKTITVNAGGGGEDPNKPIEINADPGNPAESAEHGYHETPSVPEEKESYEQQKQDYNESSLKSFLEEDSILRSKLDKEGLETVDPKKDSAFDSEISPQDLQEEKLPDLNKPQSSKRTIKRIG